MGMPLGSRLSMPSPSSVAPEEARSAALQLAEERRMVDKEMETLTQVLKTNNVTMTSPLVDHEGFPIASIDIVAVRTARARIIALRNDRTAIEERMRDMLDVALAGPSTNSIDARSTSEHNGQSVQQQTPSASIAMAHVPGTNGALSMSVPVRNDGDQHAWAQVGGLTPFARVNTVANGSPAFEADLMPNDQILRFASLTANDVHRVESRRDLGNLPSVVREGDPIEVLVIRPAHDVDTASAQAGSVKRLRLVPRSDWGGRGLLGCHLQPI